MLDGSSPESSARWVVAGRFGARTMAVSGHGTRWRRWDLTTMSAVGDPIAGDGAWSTAVAVTTVGDRPVLVSGYKSICVRDLDTGDLLRAPAETTSLVHLLRVARWDGRDVAITLHLDGCVRVWDLSTSECVLGPLKDWAGTQAFLPHGDSVLAMIEDHPVGEDGDYDFDEIALIVWDFYEGTKVSQPLVGGGAGGNGMLYPPMDLVSRPAGPVLVSAAGGDGLAWAWDLAAGARIGDPLGPGGGDFVTAARAFNADGQARVIIGTYEGTMQVCELGPGAVSAGKPIPAHGGEIRGLAIAEVDGRVVAVSAGSDPALRRWDLSTGTPQAIQ
jgi:WD40 repeat protein